MDCRSLFYSIIIFLGPILQVAEGAAAADESFCGPQVCGNVIISFPFGIETGCYFDHWFKVTCNQTSEGLKPYINRLNLEILSVPSPGTVVVNNPVTYFNCIDRKGATVSVNLKGTPFYFYGDRLGSVGCGNMATLSNQTDSPVGCVQPTCGGGAKSGCVTDAFGETFFSYTLNMTPIHSFASFATADRDRKRSCGSAFVFDSSYYSDGDHNLLPRDINIESTHVAATLAWDSSPICVSGDPLCQGPAALVPKPNDKETCGSRKANIQYPFGIKSYMNDWFRVTCNETDNGPMPYMHSIKLQLLDVSFWEGTVLINHPITYFSCGKNRDKRTSVNLTGSPFYFSEADNVFWSTGCGHVAIISGNQTDHLIGGCLQPRCRTNSKISNNAGCHIKIPLRLITSFSANMTKFDTSNSRKSKTSSCGFASLVNENFYLNGNLDHPTRDLTHVPITLQWATPISGLCQLIKDDFSTRSCSSDGQYCWQSLSSTHLCVCSSNSGGLSTDVCQEAKCKDTTYRFCQMLCLNTSADYCSSMDCPLGFEYNSTSYRCEPLKTSSRVSTENIRNLAIIIGCTTIGTILFMLGTLRMFNVLKRRQNIKMKKKYFKRNGGLLLQQHLSSNNGNIKKIKLFSSKKMEKATNNYNENRILGQGGQGTVYKGMLTDGSIVAIKKSKMVEGKTKFDARKDAKKVEQFINEVIILSQINHRNVVNLLGCCLEAEVPLLVYEFIPNGTLYDLIHCENEEFPLTWKLRLRIAVEIANALFYLHSSASVPIYHRDIKSSNILLDDKYSAKVSDFGTSRSIALEQTHLTTGVQGTFGYMDPEYFRSSQFTEKSDVYSFGVVLVELLTGEKPICSKETEEVRSLVSCFLLSMQENSLLDMLDSMILHDGPENEIIAVARLAKRCLNLNGKKRPTMKQVATELELIKSSKEYKAVEESGEEESETDDIVESWDVDSSSTRSRLVTTDSVTVPLTSSF